MSHQENSDLLTDFVSGNLDELRRGEVEAHLEECAPCRSWVSTYRLLAHVARAQAGQNHLSDVELARMAAADTTVGPRELAVGNRHIETCAQCFDVLELTRSAILEARKAEPRRQVSRRGQLFLSSPTRRLAWAASAAAIFFLVGWIVTSPRFGRKSEYSVSGITIQKDQMFRAEKAMVVEDTAVQSGASATFASREEVSFGEGFSVGTGASLSVFVEAANGS